MQASRVLPIVGAFLGGLALVFGVILLVTYGPLRSATQPVEIGSPFRPSAQDGHVVSDQDFKGKPFLVFFGFTHCPDVCPTTLFDVSEVLRKLGPDADRVGAIYVTVDPERDTTAALKDYM